LTDPLKRGEAEIRCASCNKLLAKGQALALYIKCPRCKTLNAFIDSQGAASRAAKSADGKVKK